MYIRTCLFSFLIVASTLFPATVKADTSRIALVVGNANYVGSIAPLANPVNDASDVAQKLKANGWQVILSTDATRRDFTRKVSEFRDALLASPKSTALFFYAGHGVQIEGKNYLIPIGEEFEVPDDVKDSAFPVDRVVDVFDQAKIKQSVIFLDACRDNPFSRKSRSLGANRGLAVVPASEGAEEGSAVIFSTAPNDVASDGAGRNGLFTSALLEYMDTGLELSALFKKVRDEVRLKSLGKQVPSIVTTGILNDLYLGATSVSLETSPVAISKAPILLNVKINTGLDGLEVAVDGHSVGTTPVDLKLLQGKHTVVVGNGDWNPWTGNISADQTGTVQLTPQLTRSRQGQINDLTVERSILQQDFGLRQEAKKLWEAVQIGSLTTFGVCIALTAGGYFYGVSARSSYNAATTAASATNARKQATSASLVYQTGIIGSGTGLVVGLVALLLAPNNNDLLNQVEALDNQIQKLGDTK